MSIVGQGASPMDQMNPNEEVTESGTSKVIKDEQLSWDSLDRIESNAEKKEAEKKKGKKEEKAKDSKEKEKPSSKKESQKIPEDEEAEELEEKDQDKEKKPEALKVATFNNKRKTFEIDMGGDVGKIDIPVDAQFSVKTNGEFRNLPLREIINRASGDLAAEDKFNQVAEMDKTVRTSGERLRQTALDTIETVKADPVAGLSMIAQIAGDANPDQFAEEFFTKVQEMAAEMIGKSPAEQRAIMAEMKLKSRDTRDQLTRQREERYRQSQEQMSKTQQIMQKYNINDQEWYDAKVELKEDGFTDEQMTPSKIIEYTASAKAAKIINQAVPELVARDRDPKIEEILDDALDDLTQLYVSGDTDMESLIELTRETLSPFLEEPQQPKVSDKVRRLNEKLDNDSKSRMSKADNSNPLTARKENFQDITDAIWSTF